MLRDRRGFTIFELFVVLVIAGILFAFAYPRISKVAVTASLRGARGAMITAVNVAKSSGITSGKCSWVKITSSSVTVFTTPCQGGTQVTVVSDRNFATDYGVAVTLTQGAGSAQTSDSLGFDPRGIPISNAQTAVFTLTKGGQTRTVTVGNYGRLQ